MHRAGAQSTQRAVGNALDPYWNAIEIHRPPRPAAAKLRGLAVASICLAGAAIFYPSRLLRKLRGERRQAPRKVLIIRRGGIGDAAMLTPLARALKQQFPSVKIQVLVNRQAMNVLVGNPFLDKVLQVPAGRRQWMQLLRDLRKERFDTALILHRFFAVPVFTALCGISCRLGFRWNRHGFALTDAVPFDVKKSQVQQICELMTLLGAPSPAPLPEIFVPDQEREQCMRRLDEWGYDPARSLIGIHPGGAEVMGGTQHYDKSAEVLSVLGFHPPRRWMPEHCAQLADRLIKEGNQILIVWGPGDEPAVEAMLRKMKEKPFQVAPLLPLIPLAALLAACDQVIASDSGLMHFAVAVKTPVVGIFGPTHPAYTGPLGPLDRIAWAGTECAPCLNPEEFAIAKSWKGAKPFQCWRGTNACMRELTPETVYQLVRAQAVELRGLSQSSSSDRLL
jgi:lipopolysaccharide heptosyltransferase II